MLLKMLEGECWYTGVSAYGSLCPLDHASSCQLSFKNNRTMNQMTAVLLSSCGRYLYGPAGFEASFHQGLIALSDDEQPLVFEESHDHLRGDYKAFMARFDRQPGRPITVAAKLSDRSVYNTWIELTYNQNQDGILAYAQSLLAAGYPPGTLIIDDGWSDYYGKWRFSCERFHDPKKMLAQLNKLGFDVMLWVVPYISPDTAVFRGLRDSGFLLMDGDAPYVLRWWNGCSACLDMRNDGAVAWMRQQLQPLTAMGIAGFKFDGGDSLYYLPAHEPDRQCHLWAEFASTFSFNEIRADFNTQGMSIMERLSDKKHSWGEGGIASLIPDTLALGLGGHPISSPDMIGGGEYTCFLTFVDEALDKELLLKNLAIALMMPVVQFSVNLARVWPDGIDTVKNLLAVREGLAEEYRQMVKEAIETKEPIIRYMAYVFPDQGLERITDQFMLGNRYLVAPLTRRERARGSLTQGALAEP